MTPDEVAAHVEIRHVLAVYSRGADRRDVELAQSAFHPDATIDLGMAPEPINACEACAMMIRGAEQLAMTRHHHQSTVYIEMDGSDFANVESYSVIVRSVRQPFSGEEVRQLGGGRLIDRFERRDGAWRILRRVLALDYLWTGLADEDMGLLAAFPNKGRPCPDDVSYQLFSAWRTSTS